MKTHPNISLFRGQAKVLKSLVLKAFPFRFNMYIERAQIRSGWGHMPVIPVLGSWGRRITESLRGLGHLVSEIISKEQERGGWENGLVDKGFA